MDVEPIYRLTLHKPLLALLNAQAYGCSDWEYRVDCKVFE
jgi:hypothetical protein